MQVTRATYPRNDRTVRPIVLADTTDSDDITYAAGDRLERIREYVRATRDYSYEKENSND